MARFHSALVDLEHDFHPLGFRFHDTPVYLEELRAALVTHRSHRLYGVVAAIAEEVLAAADAWEPLGVLPQWVIHGDLKFNNVLFAEPGPDDEARALSLIDLDTLSRSPLWVELGDAWRSWCNRAGEDSPEADLDMAFFRASAEGYLGELSIDLTAPERASLVHGIERISLELCVRFAADALNESYFGWDAESFESAGDHNLTRARGQLSLYRQTCATREERARILGSSQA